jgi:hypothetical protein
MARFAPDGVCCLNWQNFRGQALSEGWMARFAPDGVCCANWRTCQRGRLVLVLVLVAVLVPILFLIDFYSKSPQIELRLWSVIIS